VPEVSLPGALIMSEEGDDSLLGGRMHEFPNVPFPLRHLVMSQPLWWLE